MTKTITEEIRKKRKELSKVNKLLMRTPHPLYITRKNRLEMEISLLEKKRART